MVIKGFFFDLDGTLVDTHEANYLAYRHAVELIKSLSLGEELRISIKSGENSIYFLDKLIPGINVDEVDAINIKKRELYPTYLNESKLNHYLVTFLGQMSEHYVTALVTTAKRQNALSVIRRHGLEDLFTFMIFGDDVNNMKPDSEAYLLALKKSGLKADEVIAFEDSSKGIEAAEAAGIKVVHVRNFL